MSHYEDTASRGSAGGRFLAAILALAFIGGGAYGLHWYAEGAAHTAAQRAAAAREAQGHAAEAASPSSDAPGAETAPAAGAATGTTGTSTTQ